MCFKYVILHKYECYKYDIKIQPNIYYHKKNVKGNVTFYHDYFIGKQYYCIITKHTPSKYDFINNYDHSGYVKNGTNYFNIDWNDEIKYLSCGILIDDKMCFSYEMIKVIHE